MISWFNNKASLLWTPSCKSENTNFNFCFLEMLWRWLTCNMSLRIYLCIIATAQNCPRHGTHLHFTLPGDFFVEPWKGSNLVTHLSSKWSCGTITFWLMLEFLNLWVFPSRSFIFAIKTSSVILNRLEVDYSIDSCSPRFLYGRPRWNL